MSVIVFGSLNTDLCYQVRELPRAGETISALNFEVFNGGKGANQAISSARSGAKTVMVGTIGRDAYGQDHVNSMDSEGIDTSYIQHASKPTGIANIYIDQHGENNIVLNAGANSVTNAAQLAKYPLSADDICVFQMEVNHQEIVKAIKHAKSKGARTILNLAPAPDDFVDGLFDDIDYLILNEGEAEKVYAYLSKDTSLPDSYAQAHFIAKQLNTNCIVTLGGEGVFAVTTDQNEHKATPLSLKPQDIVDTTGAGDAFTGAFSSALYNQYDLSAALQFAAIAGSLACLKLGAQSSYPNKDEILAKLQDVNKAA
ncbi:MAG: ribokinase [Pseudomonadota bacterium]|jgi:ribokinase|nr:ribokinase [Pseudomonadota bacterium]MEC7702844.1 ribokinase [Pseudomonadota bacterium]MEC9234902.1 ribokinase [Pseudomonadota bacterium]